MHRDVRRIYAAFELYLDLHYILHGFVQSDYENTIIYACIAEATLRPRVVRDGKPPAPLGASDGNGSISRLLVADRTGLPRETVRRKIGAMITSGMLVRVARSSVAISLRPFASNADDVGKAVARYHARVTELAGEEGKPDGTD